MLGFADNDEEQRHYNLNTVARYANDRNECMIVSKRDTNIDTWPFVLYPFTFPQITPPLARDELDEQCNF